MDFTINQVQQINFQQQITSRNKSGYKENFTLDIDDKKISEEEDKKLYELYKNSLAPINNHDFQWFKENLQCFPPPTAPGIVRKAWREKLEKATPEQKDNILSFSMAYDIFTNGDKYGLSRNECYNKSIPNDLNGYLSFMQDMKRYIEKYNISAVDKKIYEGMKDVADSFELELKKNI
ncbi:hypothetical protein [Clostridium tunisiense]|uniref:hypothetical protein n=1 Tax=Clostridium tunisiense TaxID=219748 RepID=UPI0002D3344A|nr:hypothetical protein [Clostridium tunisiense]